MQPESQGRSCAPATSATALPCNNRCVSTKTTFLNVGRLRRLMEKANINASELAAKVGTDKATVSRWLAGHFDPGGFHTARLCFIFNVAAEYLFSVDQDAPRDELRQLAGALSEQQREQLAKYARFLLSEAPPKLAQTWTDEDEEPTDPGQIASIDQAPPRRRHK